MGKRSRGGVKARLKQQQQQLKQQQQQQQQQQQRQTLLVKKPECPPSFKCHQCDGNHWTVDCPRIRREPHRFPKIDVHHGCFQCGQRGHTMTQCGVMREKCKSCGGSHETSVCPFTYIPQEWHEFYDPNRQRVYFCLSTDPQQVPTWNFPNHLDTVLWHCDDCKILIPDAIKECVKCHASRPVTVVHSSDDEEEEGESDEEGSDEEDDDSSSSVEEIPAGRKATSQSQVPLTTGGCSEVHVA